MLYTFSPRHESIESPEIPEVATHRSHEYVKDVSVSVALSGTITTIGLGFKRKKYLCI